jgi:hypothetical protein
MELLCFAACLDHSRGLSLSFENSAEPVPWHVFDNSGKDSIVNLVAAVASEDFAIVGTDRFVEKLRVFEEYADGGLQILSELIDNVLLRIHECDRKSCALRGFQLISTSIDVERTTQTTKWRWVQSGANRALAQKAC